MRAVQFIIRALRLIGSLAFVLGLFIVIFAGIPWYVYHEPILPWWVKTAVYCILGGILLVLLTIAAERGKVRDEGKELPNTKTGLSVLIQTSAEVPGRKVTKTLGLVQGHTIFAIWIGRDLSALVRLILGGELIEYTEMMGHAREIATGRMVAMAEKLGADAVINLRFMTTSVMGSAAELLAYGTAVKLSKSGK
jgi:uncharacterized protein YbjQ (UPF0145 family)